MLLLCVEKHSLSALPLYCRLPSRVRVLLILTGPTRHPEWTSGSRLSQLAALGAVSLQSAAVVAERLALLAQLLRMYLGLIGDVQTVRLLQRSLWDKHGEKRQLATHTEKRQLGTHG